MPWHYTDANGLLGILGTSQFRFGDVQFLNDATERTYGIRLLKRALTQYAKGAAFLETMIGSMTINTWPYRVYACSFSGAGESISQWQRYGADGFGYCVGFDA